MILAVYLKYFVTLQCKMQEGNQNIQLAGYNLLRADYPSNSKRGGVYIFHEKTLGVCLVKSL